MFINLFSFKGRIRRLEYGLTYLGYILIVNVIEVVAAIYLDIKNSTIINLIVLILLIWIVLSQGAKRCHDRGNSGWYQIIPFYVFWMIFADENFGPNEYGNNPKGKGNHDEINEIVKQIENE